jgi:FecR protein/Protein of unknown function (DUF3352)/Putative zinc-finger
MTNENRNPDALDRAISELRGDDPGANAVRAAGDRVWESITSEMKDGGEQIRGCGDIERLLPAFAAGQLRPARVLLVENHLRECVACRRAAHAIPKQSTAWTPVVPIRSRWGFRQFAMAASVLAVLGLSAYFVNYWFFSAPAGMRAKLQSADGGVYLVADNSERTLRPGDELAEGQLVRTAGGAHAFVQLRDGSVVEMNERTEFSVGMRRKDTTVNMDEGRIIVQAAKRQTGHLYVLTPDARVSVTGTVFSVNAGMKGSRVSVVEGEVHVVHAGIQNVLHSGDQVATSASISAIPVRDEIAWSQNLDKHLALLAQFAKLQQKFEEIPMPGLRYSSGILAHLPADTMVYVAVPNLGEALTEANRIFQDQLQQSAVLREWWNSGKHGDDGGMSFEQMVEKVHTLSQYLGDEVALVALPGQGGEPDAVVMAEVRRQGLSEYLQSEFSTLSAQGNNADFRVIDQAQLAAMTVNPKKGQLLAIVRPDFVLFSSSPRSLRRMTAQLGGSGGFVNTELGQKVSAVYSRGAGFLLAANLQQLLSQAENTVRVKNPQQAQEHKEQFALTGFNDARFLIAEHRDLSGVPDNRAVLDFTGQRHGIASWLAAPAPMGSLEYVSPNAGMAVSFVAKSPAGMMDDLMQIAAAGEKNRGHDLAEVEAKLGINLRDDFAACFGGDVTFALDGPILPSPSWKIVAQVNDPDRLQNTLERLVEAINQEAVQHGKAGVQLQKSELNGRTFYVVRALDAKAINAEVDYTFADGYMIAAPSRALVLSALRTKANNDSLPRSAEFQSLLPTDQHANFSALFYQNLAPVIQPIASQLPASQLQALQEIAAGTKPTLICAYGEESSIEVASASKLFPFNLNQMAIGALVGPHEHGGHRR